MGRMKGGRIFSGEGRKEEVSQGMSRFHGSPEEAPTQFSAADGRQEMGMYFFSSDLFFGCNGDEDTADFYGCFEKSCFPGTMEKRDPPYFCRKKVFRPRTQKIR